VSDAWGGYWTEVKLDILRKYLAGFNVASKNAGDSVYLDLFAGAVVHTRPDTGTQYAGSSALAMRTSPPFSRLVFWELEGPAERLSRDLATAFPGDKRYRVVRGDCNARLEEGLAFVRELQWAPTFAFIDPKGLQVAWATLERLSRWRRDQKGRKVELWILLPETALARALGLRGVKGETSAASLTRLYGCDDWVAIHQRRRSGEFSPEDMRAEFVNLLRWRLNHDLGYRTTHALTLGNVSNQPVYTMVFATDASAGESIMRDVYDHAMVHEIPEMRSHALGVRSARRERETGRPRLFDLEGPPVAPERYEYVEPWAPPERLDTVVELDAQPDDEPESDGGGGA
jgi:three-Cys-motif partner protein